MKSADRVTCFFVKAVEMIYIYNMITTDRPEALLQVSGVEQSPGLPGLLQHRQHDLVPQGRVEADYLLDVTEQLGGLHLRQQTALLQVQQPTQEQLWRAGEKNMSF